MSKRTPILVSVTNSDGSEDGSVLWTYADGGSAIAALAADRIDGSRSMWAHALIAFPVNRCEAQYELAHRPSFAFHSAKCRCPQCRKW